MKTMMRTAAALLIAALLCSCAAQDSIRSYDVDLDAYESMAGKDQKMFRGIDLDSLEDIMTGGKDAVIFLSDEDCHGCQMTISEVADIAREKKLTIYYMDMIGVFQDSQSYYRLMDLLDEAMERDDNGERILNMPELIRIEKGAVKAWETGSGMDIERILDH